MFANGIVQTLSWWPLFWVRPESYNEKPNMRIALLDILRSEFKDYGAVSLRKDLMAGINVAAVALPLSLAFGIASGATGPAGLVTAILAGIIIGILGGIPNQVSGPTGAMSAVLLVVAKDFGLEGVWMTTLLAGTMILIIGILRLGQAVLLIPRPVVTGFTSGIAVIIFTGQLHNILNAPAATGTTAVSKWLEFVGRWQAGQLSVDWHTLLTAGIVIAVMFLLPKRLSRVLPASLVGVALAMGMTVLLGFAEPVVGSVPRGLLLDQRLVFSERMLPLSQQVFIPALSVAVLCCLQALLSGTVCANLTGRKMDTDQELISQGLGNMIIPFFGGVPATGAVARTRVGIASDGQTRLTTVFHGLTLFLVLVLAGSVIERIPIAALSGVLIVTTIRMNDWKDIRWMFRHRFKTAIAGFLVTMLATAVFDLTSAILIGVGLSAAAFISRISAVDVTKAAVDVKHLEAKGHQLNNKAHDIDVAYVTGPLFFAATANFRKLLDVSDQERKKYLILSMRGVPLVDIGGLELIEELWERQRSHGGELLLAAVQPNVKRMLDRAHLTREIGEHNIFWSADQAILAASNRL